jgi:RNA-directed DNA polymerase
MEDQQASITNRWNSSKAISGNLYKLWNRMCSGSYFPPPVKGVPIPKKSGGVRMLGVPTVADRVAQTVVKRLLEPVIDPVFHENSYGYRPGRSAHDAIAIVRRRSWKYDWVVEFDIKGLFDNIDHDLLLKALRKHCQTPWVLLYVERWLKAPMQTPEGIVVERTRGTRKAASSVLCLPIFFCTMHSTAGYSVICRACAFAATPMTESSTAGVWRGPSSPWRRLTSDSGGAGLNCIQRKRGSCTARMSIEQETTRDYPCVQFTFLAYTFRPRKAVDKYGRVYVNFAPAVSRDALKAMRQTIRGWHLQLKCDKSLADLSAMFNPILRGWRQYYGRFYESAMSPVWRHVNGYLTRWLMRKYKHLARHKTRAGRALGRLARQFKSAFVHWKSGYVPSAG